MRQPQHVLSEQSLSNVVHRQQLSHSPAYVQRVQVRIRIFVDVVSQHLLQSRLHGVAFGDEGITEASDQSAGRQGPHVLCEPVGAVLLEAEGARWRQRQQRRGAVVVVVSGVVVERRRRAGPLLHTCGESTVTREHEEGRGGVGQGTGGREG